MALRGAGESSSDRIASPSRSRSNARDSATVPDTTTATHRMPATTGAGGRAPSTTNAKLKISTTTTARNVIVASTSRLRHSTRRSLAATWTTWRRKPGSRGAGAGSVTGHLAIQRAQRVRLEAAGARLVAHDPSAAQDHDLIGDGGGRVQVVRHQYDGPTGGPLGGELGLQPGGARRVERRRRLVEQQQRGIVGQRARQRQALLHAA